MTDEDGFLGRISETPADDLVRLVYADWLEERGTAEAGRKAEFLRTQYSLRKLPLSRAKKRELKRRWRELIWELPAAWLGVVGYMSVENCAAGATRSRWFRPLPVVRFEYQCPREWAALQGTNDPTVRYCTACQKNVHFCATIGEARGHAAEGHCVAVHAAVYRHPGDLHRFDWHEMTMGVIAPPDETSRTNEPQD